jgi:hypothetical protein
VIPLAAGSLSLRLCGYDIEGLHGGEKEDLRLGKRSEEDGD